VREVDDPRIGCDPRDDRVADPDELVLEPVVGEEGDGRALDGAILDA